jgi:hypothetical protein
MCGTRRHSKGRVEQVPGFCGGPEECRQLTPKLFLCDECAFACVCVCSVVD